MQEILNYNFNSTDLVDQNYDLLFRKKRRDSCFAFVLKNEFGDYLAIRDHLGNVPLYYRFFSNGVKFSINYLDLVCDNDQFDIEGVRHFLYLGAIKLYSLIKDIKVVPPGSVFKISPKNKEGEIIYQYKIKYLPVLKSNYSKIVSQIDYLLLQATNRIYKYKTVGLYLSGGIDSALSGIYLKKIGVAVNAYTCATRGTDSQEVNFAKMNARAIGVNNHEIISWDSKDYEKYLNIIPDVFGTICGARSSLGIARMWCDSQMMNEKQIIFSQNTDTMTCSVMSQVYAYLISFLPSVVRKKLSPYYSEKDIIANYISFVTTGQILNYKPFKKLYSGNEQKNKIFLLTLAGMYIAHTPSDGEVLMAPAMKKNIIASNIYYDMDLIEYCLRIPLKYRLEFSKNSKLFFVLGKKVFKSIAIKYLSQEVVNQKKGFLVPVDKNLYNLDSFLGIDLIGKKSKYGARLLSILQNNKNLT